MGAIQSPTPYLALSGGTLTGNITTSGNVATTGSGTITAANGLTVTAGGETITSGGLTVTAGGVTVSAGGITTTEAGVTAPMMDLKATTGVGGYALINGTGTVFTWVAPNDGLMHRILLTSVKHVSVNETGGAVTASMSLPDGTASTPTIFGGGSTTGGVQGNYTARQMQAGTTFTLSQSSALTGGTSVMWAELWAS